MFNYNDIGKKIKTLARIVARIGIAFFALMGFVLLISGITNGSSASAIFGILFAVLGAVLSWVGSFALYGFGELIDKTAEIAENTKQNNPQNQPYNQPPYNQPPYNP